MPSGRMVGLTVNTIALNKFMIKLAEYIKREASPITGSTTDSLVVLKNFPVFMGCVDNDISNDIVADMDWRIDPASGVIQLGKLIPLEVLYLNQHNDGVGKIWQELYSQFALFINKHLVGERVLEIGGAHDTIANHVMGIRKDLHWTILEPNPQNIDNKKIEVIKGWFDDNFVLENGCDAVVHSHVLEHTFDPRGFMNSVGKFLKPGQRQIFALPNMLPMLERKFTNCLNFEHTIFLTEEIVDYLLMQAGFKIIAKEYYGDPHSIFYATEKLSDKNQMPVKLGNKYDAYKRVFMDFVDYHVKLVAELNEKINQAEEPVYLFGAHIFSQYLVGFGLKIDKIVSILDNSQLKRGKRLYGTKLRVESPKILSGRGKTIVILKAGMYNEEIKKDILDNINSEVIFW